MTMHAFRQRQEDLRNRVGRLPARSLVRRRLERELRGLVAMELQQALMPAAPTEHVENVEQPNQHWLQRWEQEQEAR